MPSNLTENTEILKCFEKVGWASLCVKNYVWKDTEKVSLTVSLEEKKYLVMWVLYCTVHTVDERDVGRTSLNDRV